MSGHSHWATIKRKKSASDAKRGQLYTKLAREIALAAREGGGDPETNFRLRLAVDKARSQNMPKDSIERAIKRGTGENKEGAAFEQIYYEGYAPHGIALMIECVTENRNRTVAEVRHILNRVGGTMGEAGSVSWQFSRKAYFSFPLGKHHFDRIFEIAVEGGADDCTESDGNVEIVAPVESFKIISDLLRKEGIQPEEAQLRMIPNQEVELDLEKTMQVMRAIETVEELDDVQSVYSTLRITEEAAAALEAA
jgi:YebC/PmpR family DNA-binding regulatory protein